MQNICIFTALYLPHLGGVERYNSNLAKGLKDLGYNVTIITSKLKNQLDEDEIDGVKIYRMKSYNLFNNRFPIVKNSDKKRIKKILDELNLSFIIVNTRYYNLSLFGLDYAKQNKISSLLIDHSTGKVQFGNIVVDKCFSLYEKKMTKRIKKVCVNFYGVSSNCNLWLKSFNIKASGVIYNAVNIAEINKIVALSNLSYRARYKIPVDSKIITFTGRLIEEKGILELIEGFKRYRKTNNNSYLLIAGDGPLLKKVNELKNEYIIPLGKISFEEVIVLLKESEIFCLPTVYPEGFPTSVLEAVAMKCYIIATDRGGTKELILDSSYGDIIDNNLPDTICTSLIKYDNLPNVDKIIINSYNRLEQNFTWESVCKYVDSIIQDKMRKTNENISNNSSI